MVDDLEQDSNQDQSSAASDSSQSGSDINVDELLNDMESLTNEILEDTAEPESDAPNDSADTPAQDPAKQIVADDQGLADESPLIQDGDSVPTEDVVADIDQELDQMEKLMEEMSGQQSSFEDTGSGDSAGQTASSLVPGANIEESDGQPAGEQAAVSEPAPAAADPNIADEIASEPAEIPAAPSVKETELDADLDALLSDKPQEDALASTDDAEKLAQQSSAKVALESVSIWQLVKLRLMTRIKPLSDWLSALLLERVMRFLDRFDKRFAGMSPMAKEVIGFCALGTLAMTLVALLVLLL